MKIMREVTRAPPHLEESNVLALDDPQLMKYPVAYMTEAGFWTMTDHEAAALRTYLLKGGFVIFDDFRDDFAAAAGWANFAMHMRRVLPARSSSTSTRRTRSFIRSSTSSRSTSCRSSTTAAARSSGASSRTTIRRSG